jgi:acyl-coenzyme A synthetase/AMP-(fatty) acid ligase/acyl carrier protein
LDNQYGPTEGHVVTAGELTGPSAGWPADPPIGKPIANASIYLLDERMHPVPVGVPGELFVGGACLARGYVGKAGLTAERFVPDPFGTEPGERLYRTGDQALHSDDGTLRFLGRVDDQVKVRGYRVEPGEIETLLAQHPAVRKAVVTAYQTDAGLRLAAYLQPASPHPSPSVPDLRKWLEERLPEYMVPAAFVWLDALPTTPVGKIDRKALPAPSADPTEHVPPRGPADQAIVTIWQEVLERPGIGIRDNFFDLGGHSLLIPQIVFRLNKEFGVELPLRALFGSQTVMELADQVAELVTTTPADKE